MRDQAKKYESTGEWAKQLALHLCGKNERAPPEKLDPGRPFWPYLS
jgi:hypothetical protein